MADPKTQIEIKVDQLEKQTKRNTQAISTMASWLVQAQTGFGQQDASGIEKILRGEKDDDADPESEGGLPVR